MIFLKTSYLTINVSYQIYIKNNSLFSISVYLSKLLVIYLLKKVKYFFLLFSNILNICLQKDLVNNSTWKSKGASFAISSKKYIVFNLFLESGDNKL